MVVVSPVRSGQVAPETEFVGTVHFPEISDVAAEVEGRIATVNIEDGDRVRSGQVLVRLNADLLEKSIQGQSASHEEILADLKKARSDLARMEALFHRGAIQEQLYEEHRFRVLSLQSKADSVRAEVERLRLERDRKAIKAPFDGVVVRKQVDTGEWVSPGSTVATLARDDAMDILVDVPEEVLRLVRVGAEARVKAGGREGQARVVALIPRGDVATRTFPVKLRMEDGAGLMEGMEARVSLPSRAPQKGLLVPRDALLSPSGQSVVFAVVESQAVRIPVRVLGYEGEMAGVAAEQLSEGMQVVVKGNERLRDGQGVTVMEGR
jgi:RND family efflux transporter MFP subunit